MPKINLGAAEWEILQFVSEHHPVTVREVADRIGADKGLARTTVLTVMERLRAKGFLTRRKSDNGYCYSPKQSIADLTHGLVQSFVDNMLNGKLSPFLAYLARSRKLSRSQLNELRQIVDQLDELDPGASR